MHYWNLLWDWNSIDSVRSIHSALEGWALVFFALLVLFDVLAHLSEDTHKKRAKRFERIGLCCFGIAVLTELIAYPYSRRNDELSGTEIRELSAISKQARDDADAATRKAKAASDVADAAKAESGNAKDAASTAESLARSARKEADSFEKDIKAANRDASEAKALLSEVRRLAKEAEEHAANAETGTQRITNRLADRVLTPEQQRTISLQLSQFSGSSVDAVIWGDTPEIQTISTSILGCLRLAGWTVHSGQAIGGGAVVRGILVGTRTDADVNTVRAASTLISVLRQANLDTGPWAFDELKFPGAMAMTDISGSAPIKLFIGTKP